VIQTTEAAAMPAGSRIPAGYDELRAMLTPAALALGGANIVMQLAKLPVGRGVAESRVESGNLYKHPFKRARTTFGYVMVALFGTDDERQALGRAVTDVHREVRSRPGDPVAYNALDPRLQLWVAACIYRGIEDGYRLLHGSPSPELLDAIYPHTARLATTLQVPPGMWPADRAAFEDYWRGEVATIEMDEVTRSFLLDFTGLGFLPWPVPGVLGPIHRSITAGFLAAPFREELGLSWRRPDRAIFAVNAAVLRLTNTLAPAALRMLPYDLLLLDMRRRIRSGRRIL
jgi:uncharacterized protein (DUF2236 family)